MTDIGRSSDLAAIEKYKTELAQLEAMGPARYPEPRAERIARLRSAISALEWSAAHAFYGLDG